VCVKFLVDSTEMFQKVWIFCSFCIYVQSESVKVLQTYISETKHFAEQCFIQKLFHFEVCEVVLLI